ncbi:MAG: DM13 domain-containing protein [Anaerolineae bacterium]|nr:DM13 domain-containing protein [Anaerolineae bacterium]
MASFTRLIALALAICMLSLTGCSSQPTPTPLPTATATPTPQPSATPSPTATPIPSSTPKPTATPFPTRSEKAPGETFTKVGNVAQLKGEHGITGKAVVAGLQTIIIQGFTFDGKGPRADIRLVKGRDYQNPVAILLELEQHPYEGVLLLLHIPSSVKPGSADTIAVYCPETGQVYASGTFH